MNTDYNNYGGYGFWCNKACAARKDAEAQQKAQSQQYSTYTV